MSPKGGGKASPDRTKALDKASRKLEAKEAKQDAKSGKAGKPVRSVGRTIRDGWISGA